MLQKKFQRELRCPTLSPHWPPPLHPSFQRHVERAPRWPEPVYINRLHASASAPLPHPNPTSSPCQNLRAPKRSPAQRAGGGGGRRRGDGGRDGLRGGAPLQRAPPRLAPPLILLAPVPHLLSLRQRHGRRRQRGRAPQGGRDQAALRDRYRNRLAAAAARRFGLSLSRLEFSACRAVVLIFEFWFVGDVFGWWS